MPLSPEVVSRLRKRAEEAGVDPEEVLAAAEKMQRDERGGAPPESGGDPSSRLVADRMLIGFLPFVTVNEFREIWMGLPPISDGHLYTGEWSRIHGSVDSGDGGDE